MRHRFITHQDCDRLSCPICDGGLEVCEVCGMAEGELTMECPGTQVGPEFRKASYHALLEFRDGRWVWNFAVHASRPLL